MLPACPHITVRALSLQMLETVHTLDAPRLGLDGSRKLLTVDTGAVSAAALAPHFFKPSWCAMPNGDASADCWCTVDYLQLRRLLKKQSAVSDMDHFCTSFKRFVQERRCSVVIRMREKTPGSEGLLHKVRKVAH